MTARNQPHKYCCATCNHNNGIEYKHCNLILKESPKSLQIGISHNMAIVGCASHSDATKADQWIADVIAELEKRDKKSAKNLPKDGMCLTPSELRADERCSTLREALALLRGKGE